MKALVIGLGSMGRRRVRCLQHHGVGDICGYDLRSDRRDDAVTTYGIAVRERLAVDDLADFDVVIVSTPPDQHHVALAWAIEAGRPCFVEASVLRDPLLALAPQIRARGVLVAPSCTLRFHPAVRDITAIVRSGRYGKVCNFSYHCGQYLPDWHPWEKVTDYYVSHPATGGAREIVPFELTWLVDALGWPEVVAGHPARTMDVGAPIDDTYAAVLRFGHCVGMLMVDVVARDAVRKLTLNMERASLAWDWNEGVVHVWEAASQRRLDLHQPRAVAHAGYNANIGEAMYLDEIGAFLAAVREEGTFPHTLEDDIRVLEILEMIEAADGYSRQVGVLP